MNDEKTTNPEQPDLEPVEGYQAVILANLKSHRAVLLRRLKALGVRVKTEEKNER